MRITRLGLPVVAGIAATVYLRSAPCAHAGDTAVLVHGDVQVRHRELVASAVAETAREAAWPIAEAAFSEQEREEIIACFGFDRPWSCLSSTAAAKGVARVIVVALEEEQRGFILTEQVLVAGAGRVAPIDRRYCQPCSDAELSRSATELTKLLLRRAEAPPEPREAAAAAGVAGARAPREARDPGGGLPSRAVPFVAGGIGAVVLAGGIVLQATVEPSLDGPQAPRLYSAPGIGLAIGGGLAIGAGVFLWLRAEAAAARRSAATRATPAVMLARGGAVLEWSGRF